MTSIEPSNTNEILIVDAVNSSGSGDLFNQEVTVLGNAITISSGTEATYGQHLDIRFTGSGNMEKLLDDAVTSVTIDTQAMSDNKYVVMTVLNPAQTQIVARKQIGYTDFPQKAVMEFSSGVGQTLRIEAVDGFDLYNIFANSGLRVNIGYKYYAIYGKDSTNPASYVVFTELLLLDENGNVGLGNSNLSNFVSANIYDTAYSTGQSNVSGDKINPPKFLDGSIAFDNSGYTPYPSPDQLFIWIELENPAKLVSGTAWGQSGYKYTAYDIYATRTDPATMSNSDRRDLNNYELLGNITSENY